MVVVAARRMPAGLDAGHAAELLARRRFRSVPRAHHPGRVAVVGGGVAGISAAHELCLLGAQPVVIEDRDVTRTASWVAAGLIEPVAGTRDPAGMARETAFFERSMHAWRGLAASGSPLVSRRRVLTVCATSRAPLAWAGAVEDFSAVRVCRLHRDYGHGEGAAFTTYVVETMRWLMSMRARLAYAGVRFIRHRLADLAEVADVAGRVNGVVNASGLGAARLAHDATMSRGDGHVIRVLPVPGVDDVFMDETRAASAVAADPLAVNMLYVIPRRYDIVIGGTLWQNADVESDPRPVGAMPGHLLRLAAGIEPRLAHARIVGYHVGARPLRHEGVRVELDASGPVPVVHCYGQGGSGWTLAPALAEEAVGILADATWARSAA